MKRILTGLQPSGKLHIGNYFGSMKPNLELGKTHEAFLMIADMHALTTIQNAKEMSENIRDVALDFLTFGLDPEKTTFFRQSDVPEHTELTWIFSNIVPLGVLERAHSFKDKKAKGLEANTGLFIYPILMACDILLYDPHYVPVGKDQKQHVEMTRDIALKFNHIYGEGFPIIPEPMISEETGVVPGIDGQKMSKSYGNTIEIFADEKTLQKKIMSIVTDSKGALEPKDPAACNVFTLAKLFFSEDELKDLEGKYRAGGFGYGDAKKWLFEKVNVYFAPYRKKREELAKNPEKVDTILRFGAEKAREKAKAKMKIVRELVGL
ncbi:tryptophan--tRNA ligase [Candidatus Peregrinibacteria bacterium]|nr:tryptophan--tRNA ligase [Candidatus Peregrinibacteria bacterium]